MGGCFPLLCSAAPVRNPKSQQFDVKVDAVLSGESRVIKGNYASDPYAVLCPKVIEAFEMPSASLTQLMLEGALLRPERTSNSLAQLGINENSSISCFFSDVCDFSFKGKWDCDGVSGGNLELRISADDGRSNLPNIPDGTRINSGRGNSKTELVCNVFNNPDSLAYVEFVNEKLARAGAHLKSISESDFDKVWHFLSIINGPCSHTVHNTRTRRRGGGYYTYIECEAQVEGHRLMMTFCQFAEFVR